MLFEGQPVDSAATRLRALVDGYEADLALREALPATMAKRAAAMFELLRSSNETGFQPWADMYLPGIVSIGARPLSTLTETKQPGNEHSRNRNKSLRSTFLERTLRHLPLTEQRHLPLRFTGMDAAISAVPGFS